LRPAGAIPPAFLLTVRNSYAIFAIHFITTGEIKMTYLPKPEQAWQLLSDQQKKLYPLEWVLSHISRDNKRYPKPDVVYLDLDCFRVWDSSRGDLNE